MGSRSGEEGALVSDPLAKVLKLLALASGDGEEARTSAHLAARLIKQHDMTVTMHGASRPPSAHTHASSAQTPWEAGTADFLSEIFKMAEQARRAEEKRRQHDFEARAKQRQREYKASAPQPGDFIGDFGFGGSGPRPKKPAAPNYEYQPPPPLHDDGSMPHKGTPNPSIHAQVPHMVAIATKHGACAVCGSDYRKGEPIAISHLTQDEAHEQCRGRWRFK